MSEKEEMSARGAHIHGQRCSGTASAENNSHTERCRRQAELSRMLANVRLDSVVLC